MALDIHWNQYLFHDKTHRGKDPEKYSIIVTQYGYILSISDNHDNDMMWMP